MKLRTYSSASGPTDVSAARRGARRPHRRQLVASSSSGDAERVMRSASANSAARPFSTPRRGRPAVIEVISAADRTGFGWCRRRGMARPASATAPEAGRSSPRRRARRSADGRHRSVVWSRAAMRLETLTTVTVASGSVAIVNRCRMLGTSNAAAASATSPPGSREVRLDQARPRPVESPTAMTAIRSGDTSRDRTASGVPARRCGCCPACRSAGVRRSAIP